VKIKKANLYGASTGAVLVRFSNAAAVNVTWSTNGLPGDLLEEDIWPASQTCNQELRAQLAELLPSRGKQGAASGIATVAE
jgi:hypothetical protein